MDAKWQIGNITDLSKPITGYSTNELAYLIGFGMIQNSVNGVFFGSIGSMAKAMWIEADSKTITSATKSVARRLRANGFKPGEFKNGRFGWSCPNDMSGWKEPDQKYSPKPLHTGEPSPSGEVTSSFTCTVENCKSAGTNMTKEERDKHYSMHHRGKSRAGVDTGTRKDSDGLTKPQRELYESIKRRSGFHTRDYAIRLGKSSSAVSHLAKQLKKLGLIYSTGKRSAVRYHIEGSRTSYDQGKASKVPTTVGSTSSQEQTEATLLTPDSTPVEGPAKVESDGRVLIDESTGEKLIFKGGKLYRVVTTVVLEEVGDAAQEDAGQQVMSL